MSIEIRMVSEDEVERLHQAMEVPFHFDATSEITQNFKELFDADRMRAAFDGDQLVGTIGAHSFEMSVPGGMLPMAGTSIVTVLPTHRRRGVMRALMAEHFAEVRERGEPLAALWASESSIYGRFGYAPAVEMAETKIDKQFAKLAEPVDFSGTMRLVGREEAMKTFPELYDRVARTRPGMFLRKKHWWKHRVLSDPEFKRNGASAHRRVLHTRNGELAGYAIFRTKDNDFAASLRLVELIAVDPDAEKALWEFVFGVDLVSSVEYWNLPVDSPLLWWLEDPRKLERKIEDSMWVRTIDLVACLNGRRYSSSGSLVFRMHDELCPWNDGVFRLEVGEDGVGCCKPSTDAAELNLTPFGLGAVYLGEHGFSRLAHAGVLSGRDDSLRRADAMFTWDRQPWCQEVF